MKPSREAHGINQSALLRSAFWLSAAALAAVACGSTLPVLAGSHSSRPTATAHSGAYSRPLAGLTPSEMQMFNAGKAEFAARWVVPFVSGGHWGRGPQSNAESCIECHQGNGRGYAPDGPNEAPHSLVLRLSLAEPDATGRPIPHPAYGTQLNRHGILGKMIEEGDFRIEYDAHTVRLADGSSVELRAPNVRITALWYGPIGNDAIVSARLAQPVFGLGLLQAVSESTLQQIALRQQRLGFNGRANVVWDETNGRKVIGRFGHKAAQANLRQQIALAFREEIGVNSSLFPDKECWPVQKECYRLETVSGVEAQDEQLAAIEFYLKNLAPPPRRNRDDPEVMRGATLFDRARCAVCHLPELKTAPNAQLAGARSEFIRPYTDLLLHDMGDGLADGRREFLAGARDWRTPPLWGLGLRKAVNGYDNLLHDGRARSVAEAILWHGGEADVSRQDFIEMTRHDRQALLRFLDSL